MRILITVGSHEGYFLKRFANQLGHVTISANFTADLLALVQRYEPDVVILDPEYSDCQRLRAEYPRERLKIIFFMQFSSVDEEAARQAGADATISCFPTPEALEQALRRLPRCDKGRALS